MSDTMFAIRTPQHDFPLGTLASCVGTMGCGLRPRERVVAPLPFAAGTRIVFSRAAQGPGLFG